MLVEFHFCFFAFLTLHGKFDLVSRQRVLLWLSLCFLPILTPSGVFMYAPSIMSAGWKLWDRGEEGRQKLFHWEQSKYLQLTDLPKWIT